MPDYSGSGAWTQPDTADIRPGIAMPYAKLFLCQSSWPYNPNAKQVTYHLFHHHGDPYMRLFSNVPQTISATHASVIGDGATVFPVTAPQYSFIALTVDGEIIGRADGTGSSVNVTIDPQTNGTVVKMVITKQDYYRYEVDLDVVILSVQEEPVMPSGYQFALNRAYPNPVHGRTMISYSVGSEAPVKLAIYDVTGREVSMLVNQVQNAGNYNVEWDGRDNNGGMVSSGTYFYRMTAGSFTAEEILVFVR